ncbi:type I-E CRISPR-associated protein Cas5/CasD [Saccharopolyspora phatthalungensis]|uniref:CRISPR system Cascade subunit CasD n=1 Tax=Saccharopolyspora phatthalungensis TaxID=664693 RepID=A0A840QC74_9PSEU|nr:type I-E CRISPR-associated protein Cas5/CasD [Saccharopolyspora phatthalungensis]MBB5157380.1 CRISPR system Cascade subunit CasD [Saccharopolyspora phatthalungensis]
MSTATLVLRIDAPMQSWGLRSKFIRRDTAAEPTKSGIVGLLAAACGIRRTDTAGITTLAELEMGVRVDREGLVERDFHVTENVPNTHGKNHRTVVSDRYYLADALFLVALHGPLTTISELDEAIRRPRWPLYFGRKAFVPANPLLEHPSRREQHGTGVFEQPLPEVLKTHPWLENRREFRHQISRTDGNALLRTVQDTPPCDPAAELRHDHPLSFADGDRRYASRTVVTGHVELTPAMIGDRACS